MTLSQSQEVCQCLNILIQTLKKRDIKSETQSNEMSKVFTSFSDSINKCSDQLRQLIDKQSPLWDIADDGIKIIDLIMRLLSILNDSNDEHYALTDSLIIQLSLTQLMSLTVISLLKKHFKNIDQLFQSRLRLSNNWDITLLKNSDDLLVLCEHLMQFCVSNSFISQYVIDHCFASIIATLMVLKREGKCQSSDKLNTHLARVLGPETDQIVLMRNLLLLLRCKPIKWANIEISKSLSQCIINDNGVSNLINAVLDRDETSQKQTTHQQRFEAIGTVIAAIPQLCCSLEKYYCKLSPQLFQLLHSPDPNCWRIGAMIVEALERRNRELNEKFVYAKIINTIQLKDVNNESQESQLTISEAIEAVHRLILCTRDIKKFIGICPHLFYMRVLLEESVSHLKTPLDEILHELFVSLDQSQYVMDNVLFNCQSHLDLYQTHQCNNVISLKKKEISSSDTFELNIHQIDIIIQITLKLMSKFSDTFKVDFFILLLERMTFSSPSLLICSLVGTIHEDISSLMIKYTEKSIKFIVTTLERVTSQQLSQNTIANNMNEELNCDDDKFVQMQHQSIGMCLQIIEILIKESDKLSANDKCQLKQCSSSLTIISKCNSYDDIIKKLASDLKKQIERLSTNDSNIVNSENENEFTAAMTQLNDHLMPARAHGLITLKQLIYAKNKDIINHKDQVINALKMCLSDEESYIYLSAINTLSAFAILCTDDVLPILIEEFHDHHRTIQERVNIGEVLVRLSRSIGDFAAHYSRQFIHCFLIGTKSEDATIRISSLSNLGQCCSLLRFALTPYIIEIMVCIESLLKTDPCLDVKRASVMFLHLLLNGIDAKVIDSIRDQLKDIYRLLRQTYSMTLDDTLRLHSQLAIEQIDRIARELLTPNQQLVKNIKILEI